MRWTELQLKLNMHYTYVLSWAKTRCQDVAAKAGQAFAKDRVRRAAEHEIRRLTLLWSERALGISDNF